MSLSLWTRLFNWRKLRLTAPQKMFYATIDNAAPSVVQGASVDVLVTGRFVSFFGTVTPAVNGLPSGVSGTFTPTTLGATVIATTLRLTATGGATPVVGDAFTVTLTPADGTVPVVTINCTCTVVASVSASIAISASPTATSALQGETGSSTVTLVRTAYTGDVTLAATGLPTGATAVFSPNPMTGATLTAGVVVTNDVAASTVSNDAWTITASGSGVTDATQAMTHTITSPSVTRGIPNTANAVKGTDFQFANDAALQSQIVEFENNTNKLSLYCGVSKRTFQTLQTSSINGQKVMRYVMDTTGGPPQMQMYFAGYPGQPTANRAGGVNTAFTEYGAYIEVSYSSGYTTGGSAATGGGGAYKLSAVGMANYNGRSGIEWTNVSNYSYACGLTGWGPSGPANGGNGDGRPYAVTGATGIWTVPQIVCHYWEVRALDSDQFQYKHWTWIKGSNPTTNPQSTLTYSKATSGLASFPTFNRIAAGENFNQPAANRYIPLGGYMDWHAMYVWDLGYDNNPLNL